MNLRDGLGAVRSGRDKAAYYRMWHVRQRAGLARPTEASPWGDVPFETALRALGEASGKMEDVLRLLADYFTSEDRAVLKVIKMAGYPLFVCLAAAAIGPLPLLFLGRPGTWFMVTALGIGAVFTAGGSLLTATLHQHLNRPKYVTGRLLRALTIGIEAGLPLGRATQLAVQACGNEDVIAHVARVGALAGSTQPLADTFQGCPYVPATALAALRVADASGDYSGTLRKLADLIEL